MSAHQLIDSHCHLDVEVFGGDEGVDDAIARAHAAGVTGMVTIGSGYGEDSLRRAVAVAERHPDVWASVGVHPHDAKLWSDTTAAELRALATHPRVVGLGEMGLDFHYDLSPREAQRAVFRAQIRLALELGLPIVIHDRESDGETMRILDEEQAWDGAGVLYHCYTGTVLDMREIVSRGGLISIPGIVTFKNAGQMRDVARLVPEDRYLVETDSPFLTPVPHRGKRNEPAYVAFVAAAVAAARGQPVEEVSARSAASTRGYFRLV